MRRLLPIATAAVSLAVIGAGGAVTARAMGRASSFHHDVATIDALAALWMGQVNAARKSATLDEVTVATGGYGSVGALMALVTTVIIHG